jgi:hypothetical protein
MYTETTTLIDATIENLETLQQLFADDFNLCRRTGLASDAHKCGAALEAISMLLPRLQLARTTQEPDGSRYSPFSGPSNARYCIGCE